MATVSSSAWIFWLSFSIWVVLAFAITLILPSFEALQTSSFLSSLVAQIISVGAAVVFDFAFLLGLVELVF